MQDVDDYYSVRYPKLYQPGLVNLLFNKKLFLLSAGEGFLTSIVLFFIPYGAFYMGVNPWGTDLADLQSFGVVIASILVVAVNLRVSIVHLLQGCWHPFVRKPVSRVSNQVGHKPGCTVTEDD